MLKIKDDVDLEKLIDFGFWIDKEDDNYYEINRVKEETGFSGFNININDRRINNYSSGDDGALDVIYDLIAEGLVEKIEEDK